MAAIGVIGAGTWGVALARMLCRSGHEVRLWSPHPDSLERLRETRVQRNLPGVLLPQEVECTPEMSRLCQGRELVLFVVPSVFIRQAARLCAPYLRGEELLVNASKGIEAESLLTMTEVIAQETRREGREPRVAALSGPTHAEEVARDLPSTIVSACEDLETARRIQDIFMNTSMRVYTNQDLKGVELCGALKNIVALAAGISDGLGYGDNAKAALITRGLAEMERLGDALGCLRETFAGLAGMGDLIVTATSRHSRNHRCGYYIGQGSTPQEALRQVGMVVEGVNAVPAALALSRRCQVEMPILNAVDGVLHRGEDPRDAVAALMNRDRKTELPPARGAAQKI